MSDDKRMLLSPERLGSGGVPGAVVITADCGHRAWISPAGLTTKLSTGMPADCADCVPITADMQVAAAPLIREELAAILGTEEADALIAEAQRRPQDVVRAGRSRRRGERGAR